MSWVDGIPKRNMLQAAVQLFCVFFIAVFVSVFALFPFLFLCFEREIVFRETRGGGGLFKMLSIVLHWGYNCALLLQHQPSQLPRPPHLPIHTRYYRVGDGRVVKVHRSLSLICVSVVVLTQSGRDVLFGWRVSVSACLTC